MQELEILEFEEYLVRRANSPRTIKQQVYRLKIILSECDPLDADSYGNFLVRKFKENVSRSTINKYTQAVKRYGEYKKYSWTKELKKYKEPVNVKVTFSNDEIDSLISLPSPDKKGNYQSEHAKYSMYWMVCFMSGMRNHSEVATLQKKNIDFGNKVFILRRGSEYKTGSGRQIPIVERLIEPLKQYVSELETELLFPTRYKPDKPIQYHSVRKDLKKRCERLGITKEVTPYSTRHTFGHQMVAAGTNLKVLKDLMGHKKIETTERYTDSNIEVLRKAITKLPLNLDYASPHEKVKLLQEFLENIKLYDDDRFDQAELQIGLSHFWRAVKVGKK